MKLTEHEIYGLLKHHINNLYFEDSGFFTRLIELATQGKILALERENAMLQVRLKEKK